MIKITQISNISVLKMNFVVNKITVMKKVPLTAMKKCPKNERLFNITT